MPQWITQLRKGIIEYAILLLLESEENYALNLVRRLNAYSCFQVSESTVYPILGRLKKEDKLTLRIEASSEGPPRRYLSLSAKGRSQLRQMRITLKDMNQSIDDIENNNNQTKK
ncbi:PadR family transcriptional regulator [Verrucomicrobia bacterium]|nr:PadR family transcriptional regulator [Verrucomicrobiota bacterium]